MQDTCAPPPFRRVFLVCSQYRFVTPAKQAEQRARDQKHKADEAKESEYQLTQARNGKKKLTELMEKLRIEEAQGGKSRKDTNSTSASGASAHRSTTGSKLPLMGMAWRKVPWEPTPPSVFSLVVLDRPSPRIVD